MSGFSIGAGLAAVDIEANCARTFGCCRMHLVAPTRFKEANIFQINSFEKKKLCLAGFVHLFFFFKQSNVYKGRQGRRNKNRLLSTESARIQQQAEHLRLIRNRNICYFSLSNHAQD